MKQIALNIVKKQLIIDSCQNIIVKLTVANRETPIKRIVRFAEKVKIFARFSIAIFFKLRDKFKLLVDRNFMFIFQRIDRLEASGGVLFHIVDVNIEVVMIQNASHEKVFIFKSSRIDIIQNYEKERCYFVVAEDAHLVVNFDSHKSISQKN